jgi:hypothetical protein
VKSKIQSLLGIEMSLNGYEFKPILLILGVLVFIGLVVPLVLGYSVLYMKYTLVDYIKEVKKDRKRYFNNK